LLETFSWSLDTCLNAFNQPDLDINTFSVGLLVDELSKHVVAIVSKHAGNGNFGTCPFASAAEVQMFYQFCVRFLSLWSLHTLGSDAEEDAAFYSQIDALCEILSFLDTAAVCLPLDTARNVQALKEACWPNWFAGERRKGTAAASRCLEIGKGWDLESCDSYQSAVATTNCGAQNESEFQSNAHNSIIMFLLIATAASKKV
jgi:hypothetical protein